MSKRDWRLFLIDMLESIEKIESYISGVSRDGFLKDEKTKDAVVRNLEIIGEAANQIPEENRKRYNDVPWTQIVGLRNRLIHGYFVVDYEIVWNVISGELSDLKIRIKKILEREGL
ncbi:hypothetical protein GAH_01648 [Geoglobus ahangari]|uniref:DUF86 domain-containing protein n=1 Tax=Geoglobus ahangari TaxID=113653 RepID=A0A0F7IDT0_9EURY|nr:DUF86 domain-containing protein [Geoglobus ahangari]AKG91065.1 hypothetical protein GAH_01648 [Geoglobus ahangari]